MDDTKDNRISNVTITGNSTKSWIHFINACEYYILKSKTDDGGICFKQWINFKSKLSLSQLKKERKTLKWSC